MDPLGPMDDVDDDASDSESSESAGIAMAMIAQPERVHPAVQLQLNRARQNRQQTSLQGIQRAPAPPAQASRQQTTGGVGEDVNVYDPFVAAGLDLNTERLALNKMSIPVSAEARRTLTASQIRDEQFFVRPDTLQAVLFQIAKKRGLLGVSSGVAEVVSFAMQQRLEDIIEQLIAASKKRVDLLKTSLPYDVINEPAQITKRIKKADEDEKRRLEEEEKLRILEHAKALRGAHVAESDIDSRIVEALKRVEEEEKERQKVYDMNEAVRTAIGGSETIFKKKVAPMASSASRPPPSSTFLPQSTVLDQDEVKNRKLELQDCLYVLERDYHTAKSSLLFRLYNRLRPPRPR
ncbi:Transcription initiation factor TFIID component TAF4 C-terminal domain-containing protein [Plasmodiophora brassicae]